MLHSAVPSQWQAMFAALSALCWLLGVLRPYDAKVVVNLLHHCGAQRGGMGFLFFLVLRENKIDMK
jgi:hypothetical protein